DALDEEKWLNMLGTFVKDWFRYESHFVHGRDSLVDILKERGLLSESDAVQPLINSRFKSLDTLKVKIISVTFRRVIRTNHKKASKIWRHENIQLGGCQS